MLIRAAIVAASSLLLTVAASAQSTPSTGQPTRADCARNSADPECTRVQTQGKDNSTVSPGPGKGAEVKGGGKAGGVTSGGNPATAGGSPQSSQ